MAPKPEVTIEQDHITICLGEQKFAPVQYQSFTVGPFFAKTTLQPGESIEDAFDRVYPSLLAIARKAYTVQRKLFFSGAEG